LPGIDPVDECHTIRAERVIPKAGGVYRRLNLHRIEGYAEKGW